jgi:hypothetical protein
MLTKQQEIQAWFDSQQNYQTGLLLLLKYSNNKALKNFLTRKQNSKKLNYELAKLAKIKVSHKTIKTKPIPETQLKTERINITEDGTIKLEDLPIELQKYYQENTIAYKLQRALHEKLKLSTDEQKRAEIRTQIIELDDAITKRWHIIDTYITTGTIDEIKPATKNLPNNYKLTPQEVNALRTKISRYITTLEKNQIPEKKKNILIEKTQTAVNKLTEDNQQLSQETINKLNSFNITINKTQENA